MGHVICSKTYRQQKGAKQTVLRCAKKLKFNLHLSDAVAAVMTGWRCLSKPHLSGITIICLNLQL